ncbi:MAG: PHP domain-containing protein [Anaerolineales bacterium]
MPTLEFHCHTLYSKDSLLRPEALLAACRRKGIDKVVITDHNSIAGARAAQVLDPQRVIIGEEILTTQGELLAAFVREEIPARLPPLEAIARLRAQGAFISVSHPFDRLRGWQFSALQEILPLVDALEIFNARCLTNEPNLRAEACARQNGLLATVGSDAHTAWELGRAVLDLPPFEDAAGLKAVLPAAQFRTRLSSPLIHLSSRYAVMVKKLMSRR